MQMRYIEIGQLSSKLDKLLRHHLKHFENLNLNLKNKLTKTKFIFNVLFSLQDQAFHHFVEYSKQEKKNNFNSNYLCCEKILSDLMIFKEKN